MGHHYVPQQYLRNFETHPRSGEIYQLIKGEPTAEVLAIRNVAQARRFYTDEMETLLANEIESPGTAAIATLRRTRRLNATDRVSVSLFLGAMQQRVPGARRRSQALIPGIVAGRMAGWRDDLAAIAEDPEIPPEKIAEVREILAKVEAEATTGRCMPIQEFIRDPRPFASVVDAIFRMTWRVLETSGPQFFITTDDPLIPVNGFANADSEFFFPLSPRELLHGSRPAQPDRIETGHVSQAVVRYVNRTLAVYADRMIFSHEPQPWIPRIGRLERHAEVVPRVKLIQRR